MSLKRGGAEEAALDLLNTLDRDKFQVHLILRPALYNLINQELKKGVSVHLLSVPNRQKLNYLERLKVILQIAFLCRYHKIQLLHSQQFSAHKYGLPAAKIAGCKSCYTEHIFKKQDRKWLKRIYQQYSNSVIVSSLSLRDQMTNWGCKADKLRIIENGIKDPLKIVQANRLPKDLEQSLPSRFILFVGRLVDQKGIDILIKGFSLFHKQEKTYSLLIIGEGEKEQELVALANALDLKSKVLFWGYQNRETVYHLMQKSALVVSSSRDESFGLVIAEAMLLKKPVCVSPLPAFKEFVENGINGFIMKDLSPEALLICFNIILDNPEQVRTVGKQGRITILTRYSLDRMVRAYEQLYREISGYAIKE